MRERVRGGRPLASRGEADSSSPLLSPPLAPARHDAPPPPSESRSRDRCLC